MRRKAVPATTAPIAINMAPNIEKTDSFSTSPKATGIITASINVTTGSVEPMTVTLIGLAYFCENNSMIYAYALLKNARTKIDDSNSLV